MLQKKLAAVQMNECEQLSKTLFPEDAWITKQGRKNLFQINQREKDNDPADKGVFTPRLMFHSRAFRKSVRTCTGVVLVVVLPFN
jgi:hypothetical protein